MALCECGRPIGAPGKSCARCDALKTLGLDRGASGNEIRETYRDLVKVWHPDRFSSDGKLRSRAEEKLKEVNAAFQYLNSSADTAPAGAASAAKKRETKPVPEKPYWTSKTATRTYQWYSTSRRETPRWNAAAPEPTRKGVSGPDFPNDTRPQLKINARTQSLASDANCPIHAAFYNLNSSADTAPAGAASAAKKFEEKAPAHQHYETSRTSTRTSQWSSAFAREAARLNASEQELPQKNASASGVPNAARHQPSGSVLSPSPTQRANYPISNGVRGNGAPGALFSLRRIPYLLVLALLVAFAQMWVNAHQSPTAAQDEIMNQYYEAEAERNALTQPAAQDEIMNLYYESVARKNALSQRQSAPAEAEDFIAAPSSSPSFPKHDFHLPQERSNAAAGSDPLRSDVRISFPRPRNHIPCRVLSGKLDHHGDCRTR